MLPAPEEEGLGRLVHGCRVSAWGDEHSPKIDSGMIAKHLKAIKSGNLYVVSVSPQLRTNQTNGNSHSESW